MRKNTQSMQKNKVLNYLKKNKKTIIKNNLIKL